MREIKIENEKMLKALAKIQENIKDTDGITNEELLKVLRIENKKDIDASDYFEFFRLFGNSVELYKEFKPLKDRAEVEWKDIANMKWKDVDFANNTVSFQVPKNKIKKSGER